MTFWDTVLGHRLAETLIRNLPGIERALSTISEPKKRTQHAEVVLKQDIESYLNDEFKNGRVFVSMTAIDNVEESLARFMVVTE